METNLIKRFPKMKGKNLKTTVRQYRDTVENANLLDKYVQESGESASSLIRRLLRKFLKKTNS